MNTVLQEMDGGFTLRAPAGDLITRRIRYGSFYERDLLRKARELLNPGDLVIDVGAHIGNHTLYFAGVCEAKVIAIEPSPLTFSLLEENIIRNGLEEMVNVINIALGKRRGKGRLRVEMGNTGHTVIKPDPEGSVIVNTLDGLRQKTPGFVEPALIKIDVEGMTMDVLEGAAETIGSYWPHLFVETNTPEKVLRFLSGYVQADSYGKTPTYHYEPT